MAQELKDTLQLPRTDFPMRANLVQREPVRLAHWEKIGLYDAIQQKRSGAPAFVLHDGPPFTNGDVHIGTALNKTLKDVILRYKSLRGFRTPYVPGWDCHGLPIEQKAAKALHESGKQGAGFTTVELRQYCDSFSEGWITKQRAQFKRLGVLADWEHEYRTKAPAFEADILRTFAAFIEQDLVYRAKKPVYWSIPFRTALAEAEIEYADHTSPSIYVKFPLPPAEARKLSLPAEQPIFFVIWTTTPWTLPANLAIAVHPNVEYVLAELHGIRTGRYIVAKPLLPTFVRDIGDDEPTVVGLADMAAGGKSRGQRYHPPSILAEFPGKALEGLQSRHPFIDRPLRWSSPITSPRIAARAACTRRQGTATTII